MHSEDTRHNSSILPVLFDRYCKPLRLFSKKVKHRRSRRLERHEQNCDRVKLNGSLLRGVINNKGAIDQLANLISCGDSKLLYLVENSLTDADPEIRIAALQILKLIRTQRTFTLLNARLPREKDSLVQAEIIDAIGKYPLSDKVVEYLSVFAKYSSNVDVRREAIKAIANQIEKKPKLNGQLIQLLKTENHQENLNTILSAIMRK